MTISSSSILHLRCYLFDGIRRPDIHEQRVKWENNTAMFATFGKKIFFLNRNVCEEKIKNPWYARNVCQVKRTDCDVVSKEEGM